MRSMLCGSILVSILMSAPAFAEEPELPSIDPLLAPVDDAYMNRQAEAFLDEAFKTLDRIAPQAPEPAERRLALRLIDAVLHDAHSPNRPPVQTVYHARIEKAVADMEQTKVESGAIVWKIYNMGFVVRTVSVTLAFDLNRGPRGYRYAEGSKPRTNVPSPGFPIADDLAKRLVAQCDVMFVSHEHGDHADLFMANAFLEAGKPVVAPEEAFRRDEFHDRITHLVREVDRVQTLPVQGGAKELKVIVYPGQQYQGHGVPNNVVLVTTAEGMSFVHNGDQMNDPYPDYQEDFKWIDRVHESHRVDVLMTNNWTNDIFRMVRGFDPKVVFTGHENELGHQLWDRVPYWGDATYIVSNINELKASKYAVVPMAWGEKYRYTPAS